MIEDFAPSTRNANRVRLLQALLHGPGRSRAELGRALGLSRATITAVLLDLERAGMVEQAADGPEERPRSNGRPPLQVSLAPGAAYAVGLDFGHRHVRAAVCDLGGRIISRPLRGVRRRRGAARGLRARSRAHRAGARRGPRSTPGT